jgi:uridine kinase
VFAAIDKLMAEQEQIVVAIDGDCAAGKTTLAGLLAQVYECNIIHIDHFFLRPEQRTAERLATPGGNIDYERFADEVLAKLKTDEHFSYRPFNCMTRNFDAPIPLSRKQLTIIEGSYSQHPELVGYYDLKVFLTVPADIQLERILKRNGEIMLERFKSEWIPMEKQYAKVLKIPEQSDISINNS